MKICHLSDIHWRGIARHEEYTDSFERLFDMLKRRIQPDLIINTGDTFHTKTQGITPEIIDKLSWMFRELADIAPTISILGNHDGNLTNSGRQDIISPIHEAINHRNSYLLKKSGTLPLGDIKLAGGVFGGDDVMLHVYSPFDLEGWKTISPVKGKINIALFHGSIQGCSTDANFKLPETQRDVTFFRGMDFALLGDIHRNQFLAYKMDKFGKEKPWIGYPGSLIQQNFGEQETKGFLVWDIRSQKDWDVSFVELENRAPFITVPWAGSVASTLKTLSKERGLVHPGARFRITSANPIQQVESRQLFHELKEHRKASEVLFKYDLVSKMETIESDGKKVLKTNLRTDPSALTALYREYVRSNKETYSLVDNQLAQSEATIQRYLDQLNSDESDQVARNITWSLRGMKFDNVFRYGEGNSINFENLDGIVGVFGPNKTGKSSIVGAMMYGLFNTTDRGTMKAAHIINKNKNHCNAKVSLSIGGNDYLVVRETVRNTPKKNPKKEDADKTITALNLYRIGADGVLNEMNAISRDDTDKEIRKLIGSPQDFLLTALSNQGGISRFIEEGASQRKAILSRFLDLDIFEKLHSYAKEDFALLNDKTKKYSNFDWTAALRRGATEAADIEAKAEELHKKIVENVTRRDELKLWIMQHDKESDDVTTKNLLAVRRALEGLEKKLAKLLLDEEAAKDRLQVNLAKQEKLFSQKREVNVDELKGKLAKMEEARASLSTLRESFARENALFEHQKKSVKKLETVPCGDMFPTCKFIKDSHEDKRRIAQQQQTVEQLSSSMEALDGTLSSYLNDRIAERLEAFQSLERASTQNTSAISSCKNTIEILRRDIVDARREIAEKEASQADITKKLATQERREVEKNKLLLDVLVSDTETLERQHRDFLVKLGGKTEQLKLLSKERSECRADLEKLKVFESIQMAFSKNGIPAMILKSQLPAINFELAKILDTIVDFKVTLETDTTSNVMDVYIEDQHSRRIIELASGMEKMMCSIALRVALINVSNLARSDLLIIDEGFGALDEESTIKCMELLSVLKSYFKTILVITHINQIKEVADRLIEIQNDGLESKVEVA